MCFIDAEDKLREKQLPPEGIYTLQLIILNGWYATFNQDSLQLDKKADVTFIHNLLGFSELARKRYCYKKYSS